MADAQSIKSRIRDIAQRRKNVTLAEIDSVMTQLAQFHTVKSRSARHGKLYRIDNQRFMINTHTPGSKQVKAYSVDDFLDAMIELGWFED